MKSTLESTYNNGVIEHNLLPKQRARKNGLKVKIDLYDYATELYSELDSQGYIERQIGRASCRERV